ncbi:MAG: hypothetical protein WKG06_26225 [Segetibacter sp.]
MKNFLTPPPDFKLYEDKSVYISTFLGGPLAAGYWAAENFKYLGQGGKVQKTWIIAIIATVVIFGGAFLIPGIEKVHWVYNTSILYWNSTLSSKTLSGKCNQNTY